ncbi:hypothetical protein GIB67_025011 [Kingdonia uniflora]|uniref:Uncharacterized protein n=1 Tax=Kingdonia uniflora TaxID=39325 RepID=A0A7J7N7N6_9MAGN|nr:hypothetical protein GIB67_025011 [Kingdonia uniflora]
MPVEIVFKMDSLSANEVSTSGRTNESDNEEEVGFEQFPGFPGQLVSYPSGSDAFREIYKAKAAIGGKRGRTWNDNIIWVKGNCFQRDDEETLGLLLRNVKQSVKSKVKRKESLLDKVMEEETEFKIVLKGLGLSRKKRVDSSFARPNPVKPSKIALKYLKKRMLKALTASGTTRSDDLKEVEERARLAILQGEEDTSKMVARLVKGIWLGIEEDKNDLRKANIELEKELV